MGISTIFLAAGTATRMGTDKIALNYKGTTLFHRSLEPYLQPALIEEIIVVVNPDFDLSAPAELCTVVINNEFRTGGLSSSLKTGIAAASPSPTAFLIAFADMPEITSDLVAMMLTAFQDHEKAILVPLYQHNLGHPVLFRNSFRQDLLQLTGDQGARPLLQRYPEAIGFFPTDNRGVTFDVDTFDALEQHRVLFADIDDFTRVAAALQARQIYFRTLENPEDAGANCAAAIEYYIYDEAEVIGIIEER